MDLGGADAVQAALDAHSVTLQQLVKLVEDRGLEGLDNRGLVGFLHEFEPLRNQLSLVDHQVVKAAHDASLGEELGQSSLPRALAATLPISPAEAARRVRASEVLSGRMSMLGEPLDPVRPHLAAAQRDGQVSPEQVDIVERSLSKVSGAGFDPADVDFAEQVLTGSAAALGPKDLRILAEQVVDRINPDGTLPDDKLQQDRRHLTLRPTRDGGWAGEFRLTAEAGSKLPAVLSPLARPRVNTVQTADGQNIEEPDERRHGQRMHDALEAVCDRLLRGGGTVPDAGHGDHHHRPDRSTERDRVRGDRRRDPDPHRPGVGGPG